MERDTPSAELQYLDPKKVEIEGRPCEGMRICATTGRVIGDLNGFLVDPIGRKLRYLVVKTLEHTRLLPFAAARVDATRGEIQVTSDERDFRRAGEVFPALSMLGWR